MPFERQTLSQTIAEVEAGLASRLDGADTRLRRAVLTVLARVVAGVVYGLDAFIAYIAKQILPMTADEDHLPRLARPWGIFRKSADYAEGHIGFTGTDGSYLAVGTLWQRPDGVQYKVTVETVIHGGTALCPVMAVEAGSQGNAVEGTTVTLVKSQPGIHLGGTVAKGGITGGVDIEDIENTRARLVKRWQEPPRGGSLTDWETWTLEVPGVFKAWPQKGWMGRGSVGVLFITEDEDNPIPDTVMVERVLVHLTNLDTKPITADVYVVAPTAKPTDIVIDGLDPATESVKEAVQKELQDLYRREAKPGGVILVSHIREAISTADNEHDHVLIAPVNNIVADKYELPILGDVFFQSEG